MILFLPCNTSCLLRITTWPQFFSNYPIPLKAFSPSHLPRKSLEPPRTNLFCALCPFPSNPPSLSSWAGSLILACVEFYFPYTTELYTWFPLLLWWPKASLFLWESCPSSTSQRPALACGSENNHRPKELQGISNKGRDRVPGFGAWVKLRWNLNKAVFS